jgi:tetrahydromethanopterin S-methyltransferase subunit G
MKNLESAPKPYPKKEELEEVKRRLERIEQF